MLPTCRRCQKRKIRCDKGLPACGPCAAVGLECSFNDPVTGEAVPRSYIYRLDESVRQLKAEISRLRRSRDNASTPSPLETERRSLLDLPSEICIDGDLSNPHLMSFFKNAPAAFPTFIGAGSACSHALAAIQGLKGFFDRQDTSRFEVPVRPSCFPILDKVDKSLVTVADIRELIDKHFVPVVHSRYPILQVEQLAVEMPLKRLSPRHRFCIVMAGAIGAAHTARRYPLLQTTAAVLRHWADELVEPILAEQNAFSLQALLLLILYELVEPSNGLSWRLLGMACRLCVNMSWHRDEQGQDHPERQWKRTLFSTLYELEWHVCSVLGRPSMLRDDTIRAHQFLSSGPEYTRLAFQETQWKLREMIFESPASLCTSGPRCPIIGQVASLVHQLDDSPDCDMAWLQLQALQDHICTECFTFEKWTNDIRRAAISVIEGTQKLQQRRHVLSIWLATSDVFVAGCALMKCGWTEDLKEQQQQQVLRSLTSCCNLLTAFAENWPPAGLYRNVMDGLILNSQQQLASN